MIAKLIFWILAAAAGFAVGISLGGGLMLL